MMSRDPERENVRMLMDKYRGIVARKENGEWIEEECGNNDAPLNSALPWKLTVDFDALRHLFSGQAGTGYKVDGYSCACGHTDTVLRQPDQSIPYRCEVCGQSRFYDANRAGEKICRLLDENPELVLEYRYEITCDEYFAVHLSTQVPSGIDFLNKRFLYASKKIFTKKMIGFDKGSAYETLLRDDQNTEGSH